MLEFLKKYKLILIFAVLMVLVIVLFIAIMTQNEEPITPKPGTEDTTKPTQNQEAQGEAAQPNWELTWEDFASLPPEEQVLFPDNFESMEEFYNWMDAVKPTDAVTEAPTEATEPLPPPPTVDLHDKAPEDFTWEDYQDLPLEQQALFPDYFESMDAFYAWFNRVNPNGTGKETEPEPTENNGVIEHPEQYTWEEYRALPPEQQMLFPDYFESYDDFKIWWERECPEKP